MNKPGTIIGLCCVIGIGLSCRGSAADEPIHFRTQIAPILEQHCVRCHSPGNKKGEISLATFDDLLSNRFVDTDEPDASHLIE